MCVLLPKAGYVSRKDQSPAFRRLFHAVTRRHRLKAVQARVVTGAAGCVTPQRAGVTQPGPRCGVAAQVGPCAAPGRLLGMARVAMGNAWCRPDADQGTPWKRRRCRRMDAFCEVRLGIPARCGESRSWTAARCDRDALRRDGRDAGAVTEQGGAAIGAADATHGIG